MFEFQSMMGDLLAMDVVSAPVYDGPSASGDAVQMAYRATGRREVLIPKLTNPDRLTTMKIYCDPWLEIKEVDHNLETGQVDLNDLGCKISSQTAAVYIENPAYFGFIEAQCEDIAQIAHENGALFVVCINPASLGVLRPPGEYGADIACGEGQPLGLHMSCGGATLGILACRDEERLMMVMPSFMTGLTKTVVEGEYGFSRYTLYHRMHFEILDKARAFTGTASWLWGIAAAVYMALLGPQGMQQLGEVNMQKAYYAMDLLSGIKGVKAPVFSSTHFNEFVVNFDGTGKTVAEINQALLEHGILGGKDISEKFPQFGNSALYCVTEVHSKEDIDRLVETLKAVTR